MKTIKGLRSGTKIYHQYTLSKIGHIQENNKLAVICGQITTMDVLPGSVFRPSENIKTVSKRVADAKKKFDKMHTHNANIHPGIEKLFETHWIAMCNAFKAESILDTLVLEQNRFEAFILELHKAAKTAHELEVEGCPYFGQRLEGF